MTTNCQFPNGARGMIGVSLVQSLRNRNCSVTGVQNVHPEASTDVSEMELVSLRYTADNLTLLREVVNDVIDRGVQNLAVEQETENKSVVLGDSEKNIASKSKQPAFTLPKRTDAEKKEIMEALFAEHQKKEHENLAEKEEAERLELEKKWNAENGVEDVREAAEKQIASYQAKIEAERQKIKDAMSANPHSKSGTTRGRKRPAAATMEKGSSVGATWIQNKLAKTPKSECFKCVGCPKVFFSEVVLSKHREKCKKTGWKYAEDGGPGCENREYWRRS